MKLIVYGHSDDLVEFEAKGGTFIAAGYKDEEGESINALSSDNTAAEFDVSNKYDGKVFVFLLGMELANSLVITASYGMGGCWSFAAGMAGEGLFPEWAHDNISLCEQPRPERETGSYSMQLTIDNIPKDQAVLMQIK